MHGYSYSYIINGQFTQLIVSNMALVNPSTHHVTNGQELPRTRIWGNEPVDIAR